jgi:hypothetical protein
MHTLQIDITVDRAGYFFAFSEGKFLTRSRTPLFSAARVLKSDGVPDDTVLEMKHSGSNHVAIRAVLGAAAELTVQEQPLTLRKFKPIEDFAPANVGGMRQEWLKAA